MGGCDRSDDAGDRNTELFLSITRITVYRKMVGTLNYLACMTRPDIAYAVHVLAKHMAKPSQHYMDQAKRVFGYLKGTPDHGLLFAAGVGTEAGVFRPRAVSDSAFADGLTSGKCTYGYVLLLGSTVVHWVSRRQNAIAESTSQAEYQAMADALRDITWLVAMLEALGLPVAPMALLEGDNAPALTQIRQPYAVTMLKHVQQRYHAVRDAYRQKRIDLKHVASADNTADILTKALPPAAHKHHMRTLVAAPLGGAAANDHG